MIWFTKTADNIRKFLMTSEKFPLHKNYFHSSAKSFMKSENTFTIVRKFSRQQKKSYGNRKVSTATLKKNLILKKTFKNYFEIYTSSAQFYISVSLNFCSICLCFATYLIVFLVLNFCYFYVTINNNDFCRLNHVVYVNPLVLTLHRFPCQNLTAVLPPFHLFSSF